MASIVEKLNVEHDPRFLFELSFQINIGNQVDIDARMLIVKEALKKDAVKNIQAQKEKFVKDHIVLNEYSWIDTRDYTTCYFIWYCLLIFLRAKSKTEEDTKEIKISDFEVIFSQIATEKLATYVPAFPSDISKLKTHTIISLHYLFLASKTIDASSQRALMDEIKEQYLNFKRSPFFKLTDDENRDRAKWTLNKLENDSVFLPFEIPSFTTTHNLSLAISLFLWGKNHFFKQSIYFDESGVSKSEYLHKLNLSWNQFKHRENNKRKKIKAYNFEMEESLQQKIDYLSKKLDMKKNKLIEHLVTKEYKEQHQKEKD